MLTSSMTWFDAPFQSSSYTITENRFQLQYPYLRIWNSFYEQIILDFYTYLGWAGSLIIQICRLIAALAYRGKAGERYSIARHFVSELGERGVSRLAWVFNAGLIVGSFLLLLMMPGVGISLDSVWGSIGTAFGMLAALAFVFYASFLIHAGNVAKKQQGIVLDTAR